MAIGNLAQLFQDINQSSRTYDPSSDSWSAQPSTLYGWQQAIDNFPGGAYALSQALQDPSFAQQWNQQYPGSLPQVAASLGARLNNWQNNDGPLKTAAPAIMTALSAGFMPAGGELAGDAIPASAAGVGVEGGTAALAGTGGAAAGAAGDATLQSILDSAQTPTISQGVNVADLGGGAQPLPGSTAGVDAINSAAPGSIAKGLTDAQVAGSAFAPAAVGGAAGVGLMSTLQSSGTTAAGTVAASQVLPSDAVDPIADANTNTNTNIRDPNAANTVDPITGQSAGTPLGNAATTAAGSVGGTKLGDILSGNVGVGDLLSGATLGDLGKVLGTGAATAGSIYADTQRADAMKSIYNDMAAKRQPFLDKATGYMNDPSSYAAGPGASTLDSVLRRLSVTGNPVGDPAKLGIATQAGLSDWRNAVTGFGNLGLAGEDTRAGLATNAANADSAAYSDLGRGISSILNPPMSLEDILKKYKGSGAAMALT